MIYQRVFLTLTIFSLLFQAAEAKKIFACSTEHEMRVNENAYGIYDQHFSRKNFSVEIDEIKHDEMLKRSECDPTNVYFFPYACYALYKMTIREPNDISGGIFTHKLYSYNNAFTDTETLSPDGMIEVFSFNFYSKKLDRRPFLWTKTLNIIVVEITSGTCQMTSQ